MFPAKKFSQIRFWAKHIVHEGTQYALIVVVVSANIQHLSGDFIFISFFWLTY